MLVNNQNFWEECWNKHFGQYVNSVPRQAYYIYFISVQKDKSIYEIGAGSFRDIAQLAKWGYNAKGSDFSNIAVSLAKKTYPAFRDRIFQENAFNLKLDSGSQDITFHNGFWIYFKDNKDLKKLVEEQARITKGKMIVTIHNSRNKKLVNTFKIKASKDPLYDIRLFKEDEIIELMKPYCKKIRIYPFGYPYFDLLVTKLKLPKFLLKAIYRLLYKLFPIKKCERLMFVGYLR